MILRLLMCNFITSYIFFLFLTHRFTPCHKHKPYGTQIGFNPISIRILKPQSTDEKEAFPETVHHSGPLHLVLVPSKINETFSAG